MSTAVNTDTQTESVEELGPRRRVRLGQRTLDHTGWLPFSLEKTHSMIGSCPSTSSRRLWRAAAPPMARTVPRRPAKYCGLLPRLHVDQAATLAIGA